MAKKAKKKVATPPSKNDWPLISVAEHPRARRSIARTKAWAALIGFALVAVLSWQAGVEPFEVGLRALGAGIATYLIVWLAAVALWQRIVVAEAKAVAERRRDERTAHLREVSGS
jgi:hypothetical protein